MSAKASQITSLTTVYSIVYSGTDQRKHQSSASLAFVRWIHRWPVNSPHKWPVTQKMFPFDDVFMVALPYRYIYNEQKYCRWSEDPYGYAAISTYPQWLYGCLNLARNDEFLKNEYIRLAFPRMFSFLCKGQIIEIVLFDDMITCNGYIGIRPHCLGIL